MSASQYRGQLDRKRKQRIDADKKAGEFRSKESSKRADAAKARQAAAKTSSTSTRSSKLREAELAGNGIENGGIHIFDVILVPIIVLFLALFRLLGILPLKNIAEPGKCDGAGVEHL